MFFTVSLDASTLGWGFFLKRDHAMRKTYYTMRILTIVAF